MSNIRDKILNYFESLSSIGKLLYLILLVAILIIFYLTFINNNYRSTDIDYSDLNSSKIIESSYIVYDRDEILSLDEIIVKILKINSDEWILGEDVITIKNLYTDVVNENYKKKVSYKQFKALLEEVYLKVLGEDGTYSSDSIYVKTVYYSVDYEMYIIELYTVKEYATAYIGIRINDGSFLITYVE